MEEEETEFYDKDKKYEPIPVCKCLRDDESSEKVEISARKIKVLTTVSRTDDYLRTRCIPELIQFMFTKLLSVMPDKPIIYLEKLLDDCMLFRAGHGVAPVIYEDRHLEAVLKSFDPGQRGWLSAGQIRRAYTTLGLTLDENIQDRMPTEVVFENLKKAQHKELLCLISAGLVEEGSITASTKSESDN